MTKADKGVFVRSCMAYAEAERERLQEEIKRRSEHVSRLSDELRAASRSLHAARRRLSTVTEILASEQSQFEQDFERLLSLRHVREVQVEGSLVRVLTDMIMIPHDGRCYRIGSFALELDLEKGIRVFNREPTGDKRSWDHPHVQAGLPCLGNLRDGFEKLLGECQILPLASMLLQFLESYNPETAYCPIERWEKAEE